MKIYQLIFFILVTLIIFTLANYYVIKKIYNTTGQNIAILIILIILAISYPAGKIIERTISGLLSRPITYVGVHYIAFL
ncbi:MAG: hypothetical protein H0Z29_11580 [Candidatus Marinimicrobia bacterium]|nr:hypothetical protein [Candidatus Neomarinimicrobiota bacterium]